MLVWCRLKRPHLFVLTLIDDLTLMTIYKWNKVKWNVGDVL